MARLPDPHPSVRVEAPVPSVEHQEPGFPGPRRGHPFADLVDSSVQEHQGPHRLDLRFPSQGAGERQAVFSARCSPRGRAAPPRKDSLREELKGRPEATLGDKRGDSWEANPAGCRVEKHPSAAPERRLRWVVPRHSRVGRQAAVSFVEQAGCGPRVFLFPKQSAPRADRARRNAAQGEQRHGVVPPQPPPPGLSQSHRLLVVLQLKPPAPCSWERLKPGVCDTPWLLRPPPPGVGATPRVAGPTPSWAPRSPCWLGGRWRGCRRRPCSCLLHPRAAPFPPQHEHNRDQKDRKTRAEDRQGRCRERAEEGVNCAACPPGALLRLQSLPSVGHDCQALPQAPSESRQHQESEEEPDQVPD